MTELVHEITFTLETPVKVAVGGGFTEATDIILKAPSNKQRHESGKLKQGFFRALKAMADKASPEERGETAVGANTKPSPTEVMSIIMMSDVDFPAYAENFRLLVLNDVCTISGVKMTSPIFDSLSDSDTEKMMGEYISSFLLASHLQKMATN